jgi:hypothetical protein
LWALAGRADVAAMSRSVGDYGPRDAEHGVLYRVIDDDLDAFLETTRRQADGVPLPAFVEQEFRDFLTFGILAAFMQPMLVRQGGPSVTSQQPGDRIVRLACRDPGHRFAGQLLHSRVRILQRLREGRDRRHRDRPECSEHDHGVGLDRHLWALERLEHARGRQDRARSC